MNKRNNRNNKSKSNRRGLAKRTQTAIYRSIIDNVVPRSINYSVGLYAIANTGFTGYSLSPVAGQISPTFLDDIIAKAATTTEYLSLVKDFNFIKVKGIGLKISGSCANSTNIKSLPSVYFMVTGGTQGGTPGSTYTIASAYLSDNAIEYNPVNQVRGTSYYYALPGAMVGVNGYSLGGKDVWIATGTYNSTAALQLVMGYNKDIPPSLEITSGNLSICVATINVTLDCLFGGSVFAY